MGRALQPVIAQLLAFGLLALTARAGGLTGLSGGRPSRPVDACIRELTRSDAELSRRTEVLSSIAGVGEVTAATLLADMPELGTVGHGEAASLAACAVRD